MFTVYKDGKKMHEIETIARNGNFWSFQNGTKGNIKQMSTNNISDYVIKDDVGNEVKYGSEMPIELKNRADIIYLSIMTGVDL